MKKNQKIKMLNTTEHWKNLLKTKYNCHKRIIYILCKVRSFLKQRRKFFWNVFVWNACLFQQPTPTLLKYLKNFKVFYTCSGCTIFKQRKHIIDGYFPTHSKQESDLEVPEYFVKITQFFHSNIYLLIWLCIYSFCKSCRIIVQF